VNVLVHPQPKVSFTLPNDTQCLDVNSFLYQGKVLISSGSVSQWNWQFGDNTSSTAQNPPAKTYSAEGFYLPSVSIVSDKNCYDTFGTTIYVAPMPKVDFTGGTVCLKEPIDFKNLSTISNGTLTKYAWDFGDDYSSSDFEPSHVYAEAKTFNVKLTATSNLGCVSSLEKLNEVVIEGLPDVAFSFYQRYAFENNSEWQFNGSSKSNISQWNWTFGNVSTSTLRDPLLKLTDTASLACTLYVTSNIGCSNSVTKWLTFYPDPVIYMPTAFSPQQNGGLNDIFKPVGLGHMFRYNFQIFNRWGEKLFETDDPTKGWDGTYQGELVEQGAYLYQVSGVNWVNTWVTLRGTVTVLR
jgi:gliding motility-associated-like protein